MKNILYTIIFVLFLLLIAVTVSPLQRVASALESESLNSDVPTESKKELKDSTQSESKKELKDSTQSESKKELKDTTRSESSKALKDTTPSESLNDDED